MNFRASFIASFLVAVAIGLLSASGAPAQAAYAPSGDTIASGTITTQNLVPAGTATAASAVEIAMSGRSGAVVQTTGTYTGALSPQCTVNGTTWVTMSGASVIRNLSGDALAATISSGAQSVYALSAPGCVKIRITALAAVTGTATVTINANSSPNSITVATALPAGAAAIGAVTGSGTFTTSGTTTATLAASSTVTPVPLTAQGCSTTSHTISAASTNATNVKNGVGVVCTIQISNINAAARYLKLYNKASAPTVGTDTPVMTIMLPPTSNQVFNFAPFGLRFSTGISFALTTGITVADTGAVSVSESSVSFWYL